jgi:RES domain-containing protein
VRVWRLARLPFAALDGTGARLYGGRWNRRGLAMVYCSEHLSLAVLEVMVHLELTPDDFPADYLKIPIDIPDAVKLDRLENLPRDDEAAEEIGSRWYSTGKTLGLLVPSVIIPEESNLLLNPSHRDFSRVRIRGTDSFRFDARLNRP